MCTLANAKTDSDDFFVQKGFLLLECKTRSLQERWQQRVPTASKSHIGRSRFQPVFAIEESAGHCSKKSRWRGKLVPSADTYNVQRHRRTTQTVSQGCWRSELSEKKSCVALVQYKVEKPESFYAQVQLFAREKEPEKFQKVVYLKNKLEKFVYLLDVMNSVYDKVITNQPIFIVL